MRGLAGGITFYTANGQNLAKQKSSLEGARVKTAPEFLNTRKNNFEFGQASAASKLIRDSFAQIVHNNSDVYVSGRTTAQALLCVQADQANPWGSRTFTGGNPNLMNQWEFNANCTFANVAPIPFAFAINRVTGAVTLDYSAFTPEISMIWPSGATHCNFTLMGGEMNFGDNIALTAYAVSAYVPLDNTSTNLAVLTVNLTPNSTDPIFAVAGIQFFKLVNGDYDLLRDKSFDASYIIGIDA